VVINQVYRLVTCSSRGSAHHPAANAVFSAAKGR
jgi:hypothetical protein